MKYAYSLLLILFLPTAEYANPQYILIKQTWWKGWKMLHVEKPAKNLYKWCYDEKSDTYYRMRLGWGINLRIKSFKDKSTPDTAISSQKEPDYIIFQQQFWIWQPHRLIHTTQPNKKLKKWHFDSINNTYYCLKLNIGALVRIR